MLEPNFKKEKRKTLIQEGDSMIDKDAYVNLSEEDIINKILQDIIIEKEIKKWINKIFK